MSNCHTSFRITNNLIILLLLLSLVSQYSQAEPVVKDKGDFPSIKTQLRENVRLPTYLDTTSVSQLQNIVNDNSGECAAFIDCDSIEDQKITASDGAAHDQFGWSVSISGDLGVVGAKFDNCTFVGRDCGSAYIYRFSGTTWIEEQKLIAHDVTTFDNFGYSVAISGDVVVVGAPFKECSTGTLCGSVYVYRFNGMTWEEEQKLVGSDIGSIDRFGYSVSIDGDVAVVGAFAKNCAVGRFCGAAYVYRYNGTAWIEEQKLTASVMAALDHFGWSVSISGDLLVVGAPLNDCSDGELCGAAYLYRFNGTSWVEEQKLIASDIAAFDRFGRFVSISGDVTIVGSIFDCTARTNCGSAYVYRFNGTSWVEEQKLIDSGTSTDNWVGFSVTINGDVAVVGVFVFNCTARKDCGTTGTAYVYRFNGTNWVEVQTLTDSHTDAVDWFGISVSVDDNVVFVGADRDYCVAGEKCGSVYIFDLTDDDCNCDGTADTCEEDIDNDGIIECDTCPESQMDETIIINDCDTGVTNTFFDDGCTMADVLSECISDARSRRREVSCVTEIARNWLRDRLITRREYSFIVICAASSNNQRINANIHSNTLRQQR